MKRNQTNVLSVTHSPNTVCVQEMGLLQTEPEGGTKKEGKKKKKTKTDRMTKE